MVYVELPGDILRVPFVIDLYGTFLRRIVLVVPTRTKTSGTYNLYLPFSESLQRVPLRPGKLLTPGTAHLGHVVVRVTTGTVLLVTLEAPDLAVTTVGRSQGEK